jgi:hypothetical protein
MHCAQKKIRWAAGNEPRWPSAQLRAALLAKRRSLQTSYLGSNSPFPREAEQYCNHGRLMGLLGRIEGRLGLNSVLRPCLDAPKS